MKLFTSTRKDMLRHRYVGLTTTPNHGRGQRTSKRNERFHDSKEDAEQEERVP